MEQSGQSVAHATAKEVFEASLCGIVQGTALSGFTAFALQDAHYRRLGKMVTKYLRALAKGDT